MDKDILDWIVEDVAKTVDTPETKELLKLLKEDPETFEKIIKINLEKIGTKAYFHFRRVIYTDSKEIVEHFKKRFLPTNN